MRSITSVVGRSRQGMADSGKLRARQIYEFTAWLALTWMRHTVSRYRQSAVPRCRFRAIVPSAM
jgi:hypothetical protein